MPHYVYPCDPECPVYRDYADTLFDDPMTEAMGAPTDEIMEAFEKRHRRTCERCQQYAAANVGVE